jgi:dTDP-4-dehydrorhamnose 3,5-epimerase
MSNNIEGLVLLKPKKYSDIRGYFMEIYNQKELNKSLGNVKFVQDNLSKSVKGTVRGLHFQNIPHAQSKLISCIRGEILDVALDLRRSSPTFGQFNKIILSDRNNYQLFIPKGFAHGFSVLSDYAIISYKVDDFYNSKYENGILWNDESLNIDWKVEDAIISKKDKNLRNFNDVFNPFE